MRISCKAWPKFAVTSKENRRSAPAVDAPLETQTLSILIREQWRLQRLVGMSDVLLAVGTLYRKTDLPTTPFDMYRFLYQKGLVEGGFQ